MHLKVNANSYTGLVGLLPRRVEVPPGAEAGYLYDWERQRQRLDEANKKKHMDLQKKINKLSKKNRPIKRK